MISPFIVSLGLVVIVGAAIAVALHFYFGAGGGQISLADLPPGGSSARRAAGWSEFLRDTSAGLSLEMVLYGALTLIGILLILRAAASAIVVWRQRRHAGLIAPDWPPSSAVSLPAAAGPKQGSSGTLAWYWKLIGRGLTGKMLLVFAGTVALFGIGAAVTSQYTLKNSLREHQLQQATVMAIYVSDAAAIPLAKKKPADLSRILRNSANHSSIAYILVENRLGVVAAHTLGAFPEELRQRPAATAAAQGQRRALSLGGRGVYEMAVAVTDGQVGAVRVGLWVDQVEAEVRRAVAPIATLVTLVGIAGFVGSIVLVWRINRPIVKLVQIASHISRGALNTPIASTQDSGEFGELSRALERMRSSMKAALARLR